MPKKCANGEGLIRKRPNGLWEGRIPIGKNSNGTTKHKIVYGKTQADVKKKLDEIKHDINNGGYIEPSNMTIAQWVDIYLNEYKKNSIKPTTYVNYVARIENQIKPFIGHYKIKDLRPDIIQKLINELVSKGYAPETIKGAYNVVHGALSQAVDNELIAKNPASKVKLPKIEKKKVRVFTVEEQEAFVEAAKSVYMGDMFIFALGTGLRVGELLALQWDDVQLDESVIRISRTLNIVKNYDDAESKWHKEFGTPKTESSVRSIPLLPELVLLFRGCLRKYVR